MPQFSNLELLNLCDSHPCPQLTPTEYERVMKKYIPFIYDGTVLGYLLPAVVEALVEEKGFVIKDEAVEYNPTGYPEGDPAKPLRETLDRWRAKEVFKVLEGT